MTLALPAFAGDPLNVSGVRAIHLNLAAHVRLAT